MQRSNGMALLPVILLLVFLMASLFVEIQEDLFWIQKTCGKTGSPSIASEPS